MTDELWVVFDGTEPDSKVVGLAATLDGVVAAVQSSADVDRGSVVIELPYSNAGTVRAQSSPLYSQGLDAGSRAWAFQKESVFE